MVKLTIISVDNSLGIILPPEVLQSLKVAEGDTVFLIESPQGFLLTTSDPELPEEMALARKFMRKRRKLLSELAKK
jgi:putative addiction module antidote